MELLLTQYLEERRKNSYNDVEIMEYTVDGNVCNVHFTHVEPIMFKTIEAEEQITSWDIAAFNNYRFNNR